MTSTLQVPTQEDAPAVILRIKSPGSSEKVIEYTDHQSLTIGRSAKAGLRLSGDQTFSRFHCRMEINPPTCSILDLGSRNGTKVNGQRVHEELTLKNGDRITLGKNEIAVEIIGASDVVAAQETRTPGLKLPGYYVGEELGRGAMGAVYRGRRISNNETVAIKIIHPNVKTTDSLLKKFHREALLTLRLQHKRIVNTIDFQITDLNVPFFVMEYLETINLDDLFSTMNTTDRCRRASGTICRVLEGLQYAHDKEVVHRDVKPGNILAYKVDGKFQVKLSDFGLAKNYIDAGFTDCSQSHETCGTLVYMAPEQVINCRYAKPACDIYSAGASLYRLISGKFPFEARNISQMVSRILNETPTPLQEFVPDAPDALCAIIEKAMSPEPDDRYRSAEEFRAALKPFSVRPGNA